MTIQKAKQTTLQLETAVKEWQNILCKMYYIPATIPHGHRELWSNLGQKETHKSLIRRHVNMHNT